MSLYYSSLGIVVFSNILYHLLQKTVPSGANPMALLFLTYLTATVVTLGGLLLLPHEGGLSAALSGIGWRSILLGLSIVGLELGFFLAYRAGWEVSACVLVANIAVAVVLLAIGVLFFKESLGVPKLAGATLCILGLLLMNKG